MLKKYIYLLYGMFIKNFYQGIIIIKETLNLYYIKINWSKQLY